ncbi:MAG: RasGEF domain-containing protein, partial [archaeon]|nr:RasGEF domain-containing protein [archaeon]
KMSSSVIYLRRRGFTSEPGCQPPPVISPRRPPSDSSKSPTWDFEDPELDTSTSSPRSPRSGLESSGSESDCVADLDFMPRTQRTRDSSLTSRRSSNSSLSSSSQSNLSLGGSPPGFSMMPSWSPRERVGSFDTTSTSSQEEPARVDWLPGKLDLQGILVTLFSSYLQNHLNFVTDEVKYLFSASEVFFPSDKMLPFLFGRIAHFYERMSVTEIPNTPPYVCFTGKQAREYYVFLVLQYVRTISTAAVKKECLALLPRYTRFLLTEEEMDLAWACETLPSVVLFDKVFNLDERKIIQMAFAALSPRHAAQYLAAAHNQLLVEISPHDILDHNKSRTNTKCIRAIDHFNNCISWISYMIIRSQSPKKRACYISKWIQIAAAAADSRMTSVLQIVVSALDHISVSRLKLTWQQVDPEQKELLTELIQVCSPMKNFKSLRAKCSHNNPLPLALVLKDTLFALEVAPPFVLDVDQPFEYSPYRRIGVILDSAFIDSSHSPFSGSVIKKPISDLQEFLLNPLPRYSEEKLYELSRLQEPSNPAEESSPARLSRTLSSKFSKKTAAVKRMETQEILRIQRKPSESGGLSRSSPTPPPSPGSEIRVENQLLTFVRQRQLLQKSLLPSPSSSPPSSPSPPKRSLLGRFF